jgi:hypothetical protein
MSEFFSLSEEAPLLGASLDRRGAVESRAGMLGWAGTALGTEMDRGRVGVSKGAGKTVRTGGA